MTALRGKVALVTGAGSGVGRAASLQLASAGAIVGLMGRQPGKLEAVSREIRKAGGRSMVLPADVTDEHAVGAMIEQLVERCGGVDILINCAGVGIYGPVETYTFDDWRVTIDTNVTGVFLCSRCVLPYMKQRGAGYIITLSSGAGRKGAANLGAYAASKFAVIGFMESLAEEVGEHGIKCSTILPGSILTDFGPQPLAEKQARTDRKYLEPDDVAEAIVNLLRQSGRAWTQELHLWPF
jgi:NAD(P)-dependent dehydrogenase (short-subunit alcohol dehydrogenase family)